MLGYPGAGKTTTAMVLHKITGAVHLWADYERQKMFKNVTHTYQESRTLYDELNKEAEAILARGESVIFDTNFNFYKDRQKMREIAAKQGAECRLLWVKVPKELSKQRATSGTPANETRVWGADMPEERFEKITQNLQPPRDDEPYIEIDGTNITEEYLRSALSL